MGGIRWKNLLIIIIADIMRNKQINRIHLDDLYKYENKLKDTFPHCNNIKNAIRANIQALRKDGLVDFVDYNGTYSLTLKGEENVVFLRDDIIPKWGDKNRKKFFMR
jgi:hypothetical protein